MKMVELICVQCEKSFERALKEHRRSVKLGRKEVCGHSCRAILTNKSSNRDISKNVSHLDSGNRRDEFTPFRWYMARIKSRKRKKGDTNLTLSCLKDIWDGQNGICPFTGWKMVLPINTTGRWPESSNIIRASLDRIDSSKGYVIGNVRFICFIANLAKNKYSDSDLINFCKSVTNYGEKEN